MNLALLNLISFFLDKTTVSSTFQGSEQTFIAFKAIRIFDITSSSVAFDAIVHNSKRPSQSKLLFLSKVSKEEFFTILIVSKSDSFLVESVKTVSPFSLIVTSKTTAFESPDFEFIL